MAGQGSGSRADADKAAEEVTFRIDTYTTRDANSTMADKRATRAQTRETDAVAKVDGEIALAQEQLTLPSLTGQARIAKADELEGLQIRRRKLLRPDEETPGYTRFIADVGAGEDDGLLAFLQAVLAGIGTHRATLTA